MKKSWKKALLAGLSIVMMGSFIAGCGSDNNGAANKDVLKVGVTNFASTLEPTENFFAWVVMRYGVGETLAKFDEHMKPQPWIASKWEVSPDHKTWTFTINDKVKFSNGKKVDAAAVKASIERAFEKSNRAKTFFEYDSMEANGQQLVIHTTKEYPNMPGLLADPLFNTRAMSLQSGDVDMAVNIGAGEMGLFQNNDKFKVDEIASLRVVLARINQKGVLGDDKVRAAVISATDRKNYADVLLKGTFIPGSAPIPPSMDYGFKDLKDPNAYNPERSKQLLAEDGWKDTDGDGILDKDGKPLTFDFVVYNSRAELPLYAEAVQADLKKVGIDMKIKTVDYNLIDKMGQDGDYDMLISNIVTANTGDPIWFLANYWHTNVDGSNPQNGSGYSNPQVDQLLDAAETEFDPAKRRDYAIQIQQLLMNDGAALFLGYPKTNIVTGSYLKGAVMYPSDYYWITNKITK
ncbi:MAG: ABC transporter substrate-binding protein [Veillonella sp.]|uniref:ABC transporter substrate-binding protein n=1 Tax=Veillonella sp. TaxID=1926307 RepID=UPI002580BB07|nr:ABC transporter substrate-binding protein [Veillonella sp.]MBS6483562.1 ABC transporter substrate-binding protein [Veillonella sp.]